MIKVKNVSGNPVLVGPRFMWPGETRDIALEMMEQVNAVHPGALVTVGAPAVQETPSEGDQVQPATPEVEPAGGSPAQPIGIGEVEGHRPRTGRRPKR